MKKQYLLYIFLGSLFLFSSAFPLTGFIQKYEDIVIAEVYPIIGSTYVTDGQE
jgi:hypothetical protein